MLRRIAKLFRQRVTHLEVILLVEVLRDVLVDRFNCVFQFVDVE
jgi:hypothetical protein